MVKSGSKKATIIPAAPESVQKAINKYAYKPLLQRYLRKFFRGVEPGPANGKRVLLFAGLGAMFISPVEILIYHLLRKEGYEVDYMVYDASIPICEIVTRQVVSEGKKEKMLQTLEADTIAQLTAANVAFSFVRESPEVEKILASVGSDVESMLSFAYEGINFGEIIRNVLYRYFKSLTFGEGAADAARSFLKLSLVNYLQVKELVNGHPYDFALYSHGIYASWEPIAEYCRKEGIRFVCYDRAKTSGTVNFNINQPAPDWSMDSAWQRYSEYKLTEDETSWVHGYLRERESQKNDVFAYNFSGREKDPDALRTKLGIPGNCRVITLFTNLIWDAANVARDIAFPTFAECIFSTIEELGNREDLHILVRSHPAEKVLGTSERYAEIIRRRFGTSLPANVTFVEPEMDVNSFSLIDISDIGVVNTSTVGLEFAMSGKPVLLISQTHYRGKGFTFDVENREQYFSTVKQLLAEPALLPMQIALAEKYFYMMMALYQQKMPIHFWKTKFNGYGFKHFNDLPTNERIFALVRMFDDETLKDLVTWPRNAQG